MARLNGIQIKFDWAHKQAQEFNSAVTLALRHYGNSFRTAIKVDRNIPKPPGTTDAREWDIVTLYITDTGTLPPEIGLRIGELVHHFRGGLDHLAWQLVPSAVRRGLKANRRRQIQFPMARSQGDFTRQLKRRLPGVPPHQITIIERFQPYHHSVTGKAMRLLRNLSDIDKHRIIVLPIMLPSQADLKFTLQGAQFIEQHSLFERVTESKQGTELARFRIAVTSLNSKVDVEGNITHAIGFPRNLIPPFAGVGIIGVADALEEITNQCSNLLREISDNP